MVQRKCIHQRTLLLLIVILGVTVTWVSGNKEKNLFDDLMGSYGSKSIRPIRNPNHAVSVTVRLLVANIIEFDEPRQQLAISVWRRLSWRDEFLVWDPDDYDGQTDFQVFSSDIWIPQIVVLENVRLELAQTEVTEIIVSSDGTVNWFTPMVYKVSCNVDVRRFPFDVQRCNVSLSPWVYQMTAVDLWYLVGEDSVQTVFSEDGVWSLMDVGVTRHEVKYTCCEELYSQVVYTLTFERSPRFYIYSILIPSILLTAISLAVFCVPAESGEKISLGMTNLLAFVLFQQLIADNMPPLGDQTPIINIYLFCMVIVGCASIFVSVFVLRLYHTSPDKPIPQTVVGLVKCLSHRKVPVTWPAVSRVTDKVVFVLFLAASIVIAVYTFVSMKIADM